MTGHTSNLGDSAVHALLDPARWPPSQSPWPALAELKDSGSWLIGAGTQSDMASKGDDLTVSAYFTDPIWLTAQGAPRR